MIRWIVRSDMYIPNRVFRRYSSAPKPLRTTAESRPFWHNCDYITRLNSLLHNTATDDDDRVQTSLQPHILLLSEMSSYPAYGAQNTTYPPRDPSDDAVKHAEREQRTSRTPSPTPSEQKELKTGACVWIHKILSRCLNSLAIVLTGRQ